MGKYVQGDDGWRTGKVWDLRVTGLVHTGMQWYELVCTSIYQFVLTQYALEHTSAYMVCTSNLCQYTGFRGEYRDAVMRDIV